MKILICGGRFFQDKKPIWDWIRDNVNPRTDIVIHGACHKGADKLADEACDFYGIPTVKVFADWTQGLRAGPMRNQQMIDLRPDLVAGFWDGLSPGTRNTLTLAFKAKIPYQVIAQAGCLGYVTDGLLAIEGRQSRLPL